MKKIALFTCSLLLALPLFAQEPDNDTQSNIQTSRQGFGNFRGMVLSSGFVNAKMKTKGSRYLFDNWENDGIIYMKDKGRVKVKNVNINMYTNKLEALFDGNKVFSFDSDNLMKLMIDDRVFRIFHDDNGHTLYELVYNGKTPVYKFNRVTYAKGSPNPMSARPSNKYFKHVKYFLYKNGELEKLKVSSNSLSKSLKNEDTDQETIAAFIKKYELDLEKDTDLIKLLEFVDTAKSQKIQFLIFFF